MFLSCDSVSSGKSDLPTLPYLRNLQKFTFLPDHDLPDNDGLDYILESYYHRINLVRRLPALKSVAFTLATWNNEAGVPSSPEFFNFRELSFTHSMMHEADLCCLIGAAKALSNFRYKIGGRRLPEGGQADRASIASTQKPVAESAYPRGS
ncbi:hypothetical protein ASPACDRAFT_1859195 [Aspergillus aculeatus ATCC 16872]|uniref:Uncharacterized protein n=1 Tax=Aspergillus aculeatus (strain ATCC 16872 / CBS 172.66 / WB 5094) TaxID=690307 RepID=A0A1L9WK29_ASPA1|nr:uncharacterized protein ASPACDRAFT_1859195 [Aspergillus aculeatus ATCC 16872]OJJ96513.1 hypothetical protein ASPACDRAFT_1859195 [Aspergillus aculeatus ATCC 16872]